MTLSQRANAVLQDSEFCFISASIGAVERVQHIFTDLLFAYNMSHGYFSNFFTVNPGC